MTDLPPEALEAAERIATERAATLTPATRALLESLIAPEVQRRLDEQRRTGSFS